MSVAQVQGTNDLSTLSKRSMVERGYFKDEFVSCFTRKAVRRTPLINLGYYVRSTVVDTFLKSFLKTSTEVQILSLGAGFDTSYFRLQSTLNFKDSFMYYEVDFPEVVRNKIVCIQTNDKLSNLLEELNVLDGGIGLQSRRYCIIAQDLNDTAALEKALTSVGFNFNLPTLLFSECAITYMKEDKSTQLITWAAESFPLGIFFTYEQILPDDGFGLFMKKHFENINSPLQSLDTYKTLEDQSQRYLSAGWCACKAVSALDAYLSTINNSGGEDEERRALRLEPFDEWEEWHLKCSHYAAVVAWNVSVSHLVPPFIRGIKPLNLGVKKISNVNWVLKKSYMVETFGHCSVRFTEGGGFIVIGGFGLASPYCDEKHSRIGDLRFIRMDLDGFHRQLHLRHDFANSNVCLASMYHRCCQRRINNPPNMFGGSVILYGGRTSPARAVNVSPKILTVTCNYELIIEDISVSHGESPAARYRHSLEIVDGQWLVVFGGRTSSLEVLDDLWALDLNSDVTNCRWERIKPTGDKPAGRFSHGCAVTTSYDYQTHKDCMMYISGGLDSKLRPLSDIWRLELGVTCSRWTQLFTSTPILPRYGHTVHIIDQRLLIMVGGVNTICGQQPGVGIVDLQTLVCTELEFRVENPEVPIMLHNHWSVISQNNSIIVIGGGGNCFSFGTHLNKFLIEIPIDQFL